MALDRRISDQADALLEVVLDCVDPTRCIYDAFVWGSEPVWWDCDQIAVWTGGPNPIGFQDDPKCVIDYEHTFSIGIRICCPGAAYNPDEDQEKPDYQWLSSRSRTFRRTIDTLVDCLTCKNKVWQPGCKKPQRWSVSTNVGDTTGCMTAVITTTVGPWNPHCCFPNTDPEIC